MAVCSLLVAASPSDLETTAGADADADAMPIAGDDAG